MAATGSMDDPAMSKANSAKCAKEKNRQAQRRFRERQKGLIQALKERADSLQKQVHQRPVLHPTESLRTLTHSGLSCCILIGRWMTSAARSRRLRRRIRCSR